MGGALAGHTLSFSRTSSPDCNYVVVILCGCSEQGRGGGESGCSRCWKGRGGMVSQ